MSKINTMQKKLEAANIPFSIEQGFSGFTYTQFVFKDRQTAIKAEKALGEHATKHHKQWAMQFYN